ncbi:inositol-3-phosphate synthase [Gimesia algae]|uniref:Myo-inositol-1-phosphate synthase n=1 Tax=Gimesia algae TaxID=2527971 RepID=A0A517VEX8_9PLAN|nr:inositol-3-phosphate synthase [Gimesia algae]QDT91570.1 Myo-inositol-1-phosphate synthase [Gimesia algae]
MTKQRIGIWIIGAWGGVSTTVAVGLTALQKGLSGTSGLVSENPYFEKLNLADWDQLVIGGHEIRDTSFVDAAKHFSETSGVFHPALLQAVEPELKAVQFVTTFPTFLREFSHLGKVQSFRQ